MGTENEGAGEGNAPGASDPKKDALYEDRPTSKKIIRVVTVVAYMVSVSFVAIVLSAYYVFLWQPPNPRLLHRDHLRADPQVEYLVDKPPMEVAVNESLSADEIRDKVNFFREEILRARGVNISFQLPSESADEKINNAKVSRVELVVTNGTGRNNSQTQLNPIVRASLGNTEMPMTQITLRPSTDVYENLDDVTKSSTVFMETEEISGSSSATPLSSSYSPSYSFSSSSAPESEDKSYKASSVNDNSSATASAFVTGDSSKFSSVTRPSIKGITPTRAYELLESLGNTKATSSYVGSSSVDERTNEGDDKNAEENVGLSQGSKPPKIWQSLEKTMTTSGRRREDPPEALESSTLPIFPSDPMGSHISRLSSQSSTNNTEKLPTNYPPENELPIEIVPEPAEELEPVLDSGASAVPAVVQPDPEFVGKEQQSKEQLIQDGDFAFI